mmetsp:Transcript_31037/g.77756  ORF Transcript_31037/g.77756 Transcript_31037/m.77756 type:complete len:382 (-) Transcript_31037:473-1618(-)
MASTPPSQHANISTGDAKPAGRLTAPAASASATRRAAHENCTPTPISASSSWLSGSITRACSVAMDSTEHLARRRGVVARGEEAPDMRGEGDTGVAGRDPLSNEKLPLSPLTGLAANSCGDGDGGNDGGDSTVMMAVSAVHIVASAAGSTGRSYAGRKEPTLTVRPSLTPIPPSAPTLSQGVVAAATVARRSSRAATSPRVARSRPATMPTEARSGSPVKSFMSPSVSGILASIHPMARCNSRSLTERSTRYLHSSPAATSAAISRSASIASRALRSCSASAKDCRTREARQGRISRPKRAPCSDSCDVDDSCRIWSNTRTASATGSSLTMAAAPTWSGSRSATSAAEASTESVNLEVKPALAAAAAAATAAAVAGSVAEK